MEVVCNLDWIGVEWSGVAKDFIAWSNKKSSYSLESRGCNLDWNGVEWPRIV